MLTLAEIKNGDINCLMFFPATESDRVVCESAEKKAYISKSEDIFPATESGRVVCELSEQLNQQSQKKAIWNH
jgi:hypothetical protein